VLVEAAEAGDELVDAALDAAGDQRDRAGGVEVAGDLLVELQRRGLFDARQLGQVGIERRIGGRLVCVPVSLRVGGGVEGLQLRFDLLRGLLDGGDRLLATRLQTQRDRAPRIEEWS
jgi:hypothetical protein